MRLVAPVPSLLSRFKYRLIKRLRVESWEGWSTAIHIPDMFPSPNDSERAVEIPWAARAVAQSIGLWLDVGYAHAEPRYWKAIARAGRFGVRRFLRYGIGLDLVPPRGDSLPMHVHADVVTLDPGEYPAFAMITCISTLEHVGCDNRAYGIPDAPIGEPERVQCQALVNMLGLLSRGGTLLVSVPFGVAEDHGWFIQYDSRRLGALRGAAARAQATLEAETIYAHCAGEGWRVVPAEKVADVRYREGQGAGAVALLTFRK